MTPMSHARFTLGDPATDGLDFLVGARRPQRPRHAAWRLLAFAAILLATFGAVVALDAAGVTVPVAAEGVAP